MRHVRRFAGTYCVSIYAASIAGLILLAQAPLAVGGVKITVTGSSTVAPVIMEIGKRFEAQHREVRVDVQSGGSSRGIADARQGTADIGMASRALAEAESDLKGFTIARDGIGIILNRANPVASLTASDVAAIYTGKVTNWKAVGGNDAPITVVNKAEGRSTLELFLHYFKLKNTDVKSQIIIGDNEQGIKTVAGNANAIGYVSVGTAEFASQNKVAIRLLPVGEVAATTENIRNGSYALARSLTLITKSAPQGMVKAFIDFAQSESVHDIIKGQYFVPEVAAPQRR
jgi:phosphate transport system substrate-binding protein